ncbi:MAG: hypothetical protein BWX80_03726 [Candidatus Hydrogenedentes bacterium ADurb.Bin101]|nr:MAG: hypothetical protein BWX80_03726 [Candidatus Hydrogenedentes bacterium ADurb.Bin101]
MQGIFPQAPGGSLVPALHFIAANLVYGLGGKPEMAHHGNTGTQNRTDDVAESGDRSFEFDGLGAALGNQPARVADRLGHTDLVGKERHVGDKQGVFDTRAHHLYMMQHHVHGHAQGVFHSRNDITEGIPHKDGIHARLIYQCGRRHIIRR